MSKVRILSENVIQEVLDMQRVVEEIEQVYISKSTGISVIWPMVFYEFEPGKADMDIRSGYFKDKEIYGLKQVSWFGGNRESGLPELMGTIVIFDSKTGAPAGILNAGGITGMRTGAAGAIGAKFLARKDSENLLLIGAGNQATFQIAATLIAMDNIKTVRIYDPLDFERAQSLSLAMKQILSERFLSKYASTSDKYNTIAKKFNVNYEAVSDIKEAVGKSDIVISVTPSTNPIIMKDWVKKGTHFSCVGADMEGKQELDENIFANARVYVDDINQAIRLGESEIPIKKGIISKEDIISEIGCVIKGDVAGRKSDDDITIFDTTGIALQDLATASLALDLAERKGLGIEVDL